MFLDMSVLFQTKSFYKRKPVSARSISLNLDQSLAGPVRVLVGTSVFSKWYRVHTPIRVILREAFASPILKSLNLSPNTAIVTRCDVDTGLIEIEPPVAEQK